MVENARHLVIVDGMGFLFRAYHAVRGNLTRADGLPTNALYGFAQMLVKVVDDLSPDECVVALDSKPPNWRHKIYSDYKANRPPPDEAMLKQLPFVEPLIRAFGLPLMRLDGVEADDIIATLVARHKADKVTIVTSDKDLLQLVGGNVKLLDTLKEKWSGPDESVEKFGVLPELVVEVQGLMGDSSDNIPGVPGVGPKTAAELVQKFGRLDELFANLDKVERETLREKLRANKDNALMSRELAKLKFDVELPAVDIKFHPRLHEAADYLRDELEFKTLAARLEKRKGSDAPVKAEAAAYRQPVEMRPKPAPDKGDWGGYETVITMDRWQWWMAEVRKTGVVAFDTETTSLDPYAARLVGVSLSVGAGKACYVPVKMAVGAQSAQGGLFDGGEAGPHGVEGLDIIDDVCALLRDESVRKLGHNIKYDWQVLARACGIIPDNTGETLQTFVRNFDDTMLMSACLDGGRWGHGLDDSALRHLGHAMIKYEDVCGKGKAQVTFDKAPLDAATAYAAEDADATWRLWEVFSARLEKEGFAGGSPVGDEENLAASAPAKTKPQAAGFMEPSAGALGVKFVYEKVERPLLPLIVAIESRGVTVDTKMLKELGEDFAVRMAELEKEIWKLAGHEFNVQSTQQLAVVLFDEIGVGSDKMKKSRSTAAGILEELAEDGHEIAKVVVAYRQLAKLRSTYVVSLIEERSEVTGRVHTNYMQVGAGTGRFASSDPNLQNIPIRTEEGRKIRKAFVARNGWVMVSADYSQIELRLLAHFSGSQALKKAFDEGLDIHAYTASLIHNVSIDEVTKDWRRAAKVINFGLVYGMGARSMAAGTGASVQEAQAWIDAYFKRYEGVREYMDLNKRMAHEKGYVETLCGRRVWLPEINSTNGGLRAGSERAAINAPLQGSNADIIKLAMPAVEKALKGKDAQLLMQVHDELVLECAPELVGEMKDLLPRVMGGVVKLSVPLAVEVGSGPNWDDAH